jgi:flagellar hook protein FlgE
MISAIQNAAAAMVTASQSIETAPIHVLRAALDTQKDISQQMINMAVQSSVYDANAKVIETSDKMLDIIA